MNITIINKVMNRRNGIFAMLFFLFVFNNTQGQTIALTYDPLKSGLGFHIQSLSKIFNPVLSYELGKYDEKKSMKIGLGVSFLYDENCYKQESVYFNLSICYGKIEGEESNNLTDFSAEIGGTVALKRQTFLIMFDPLKWDGKIGFGIKF